VMCQFTRFLICVPLRRERAIDAARALNDHLFNVYAVPKEISSDRGTHFNAQLMREFATLYGVSMKIHVAWRPQSTGSLERAHRTLKNALYSTCAERNCCWVETLPFIVNAMNSAHNAATACSPYFAVFGRKPDLGLPELPGKDVQSTEPLSYGLNIRLVLERVQYLVSISAADADKALEKRLNKGGPIQHIDIGDEVYLKRENSAVAVRSKLPWVGTYRVIDTNQHVVRITDESGNTDWVHKHHILKHVQRKPELEISTRIPVPPPTLDSCVFKPGNVTQNLPANSTRKSRGPNRSTDAIRTPEVPAVIVDVQKDSFLRRSIRRQNEPERFGDGVKPTPRKARKR